MASLWMEIRCGKYVCVFFFLLVCVFACRARLPFSCIPHPFLVLGPSQNFPFLPRFVALPAASLPLSAALPCGMIALKIRYGKHGLQPPSPPLLTTPPLLRYIHRWAAAVSVRLQMHGAEGARWIILGTQTSLQRKTTGCVCKCWSVCVVGVHSTVHILLCTVLSTTLPPKRIVFVVVVVHALIPKPLSSSSSRPFTSHCHRVSPIPPSPYTHNALNRAPTDFASIKGV